MLSVAAAAMIMHMTSPAACKTWQVKTTLLDNDIALHRSCHRGGASRFVHGRHTQARDAETCLSHEQHVDSHAWFYFVMIG